MSVYSAREYVRRTHLEVGASTGTHGLRPPMDAFSLSKLAGLAVFPESRQHIDLQKLPTTYLGQIVHRLVAIGTPFEPSDTTRPSYVCYAAEPNFYNTLKNPLATRPNIRNYAQTIIHTFELNPETGLRIPVLVTKGSPNGDLLTMVLSEIPGDNRFPLGMIGTLYEGQAPVQPISGSSPSVVVRDIIPGTQLKVRRPSTMVAFPQEVRSFITELGEGPVAKMTAVHRDKTIEDFASLARGLIDKITRP